VLISRWHCLHSMRCESSIIAVATFACSIERITSLGAAKLFPEEARASLVGSG